MTNPTLLRAVALVVCAAASAACAPRTRPVGPRPEALLSERPAPADRHCVVAALPESLPAVDAVVDSAGLDRALRGLLRGRPGERGYAVLSLSFDRNGWNSRREVIEHDLPAALADSLQAMVFAHRREVAPGEPWGARLRVDLDAVPRLRIGRQEQCAPRLREDPQLGPFGVGWDPRELYPVDALQRTVWVQVRLDESGRVVEARLEHGVPARMESILLNYVRTLGFDPATVDGIPVGSGMRIPVRVGNRE